jgi:hypothetical protein
MTSFIVTSTDQTKRQEYIQEYCKKLTIDSIDITIIKKDTALKQNINTIGIEEIKNMQKKIFFKPIKSPTKAVILEDAQLLTAQAQNALLKILEEPPNHTIIILSSASKEPLLPTVISRCQVIELEEKDQKLSEAQMQELTEFIENLSKMPISEKFKKAESLAKEKEKAIEWTTKLILVLRKNLLSCHSERTPNYLHFINTFQKAHTLLKTTNVNPRFLLETTLLCATIPS